MVAVVYLLVALATALPMLALPEWTGTEARRVQIALEMLRSGDWLVPTLGGEPTLSKPPLFYWCLAWSIDVFGTARWVVRLPGLISFAGLASVAHGVVARTHSRGAAWCAGLGILLSPMVLQHAAEAEIDAPFAAVTGMSLLLCARGAAYAERLPLLLGGVVGGVAMLIKGVPYLMFLLGTMLVWLRRRRGYGMGWALLPMLLLPLAYYVPLLARGRGGDLADVAVHESVARVATYELHHVLETPLYLIRAPAVFLPYLLFLFYEYRGTRRARPDRPETFVRMCAAAAFASVLVLALFPARPSRYLLPGVALFVVAVSPSVAAFAARPGPLPTWAIRALRGLGVLGACGLFAVAWLPWPLPGLTPWFLVALGLTGALARTRRDAVVALLALPGVATATVQWDSREFRALWREPFSAAGTVLREVIDEHGAAGDIATRGHIPSQSVLELRSIPPADELGQRVPTARWLLIQEPNDDPHDAENDEAPDGYRLRARVQVHKRSLWLMERR